MLETRMNDVGRPYPAKQFIRDVWRFIKPYKGRFFVASFARFLGDLAWLYPGFAMAKAVTFLTNLQPGVSLMPLVYLGLGGVVAVFFRYVGKYVARMQGNRVAERATLDAKLQGMDYLSHLDLAWHEQENAGNKLKRIDSGGEALNAVVRVWINNVIEIIVNFIGVIAILSTFDVFIAVATGGFLVTYYLLSTRLLRRATAAARRVNAKQEELQGLLFEGINNIRTVKVLAMNTGLMKSLRATADDLFERVQQRVSRFQIRGLITGFWAEAFRIGCLAYIVYGIVEGQYEAGFMMMFFVYFNGILASVAELSEVVAEGIVIAKHSVSRMMEIYETPIYRDGKDAKKQFPKSWKKISLQNVGFSYGGD